VRISGFDLAHGPKIECGRASHPTAFVRGFLLCLITAWRRNDRFSPTALERSAAFAKASCRFMISRPKDLAIQRPRDHESATAAVASGPALLACSKEQSQDGGGGRNARATRRACARFWIVPRQFTLENHRLPLALPQSFGKLRKLHVSLNPLSASLSRPATQKLCPLVQKLWTMRLPCGRPRKTKNKHFPPDCVLQCFQ
jgi:hypothetical protein